MNEVKRSRTGGHHLGVKRGLDHVAKKGGKAGFPRKEIRPCERPEKETGTSLDKVLTVSPPYGRVPRGRRNERSDRACTNCKKQWKFFLWKPIGEDGNADFGACILCSKQEVKCNILQRGKVV